MYTTAVILSNLFLEIFPFHKGSLSQGRDWKHFLFLLKRKINHRFSHYLSFKGIVLIISNSDKRLCEHICRGELVLLIRLYIVRRWQDLNLPLWIYL